MNPPVPGRRHDHGAVGWQRAENALTAVAVVLVVIARGQPWWILPAAFLAFDISALGYLANERVGALCYNLVHNYAAPAVLVAGWAVLQINQVHADWIAVLAACWGFHVAVDRALGFGLKTGPFAHTHLGIIGASRGQAADRSARDAPPPHRQ
jgi:hypothetical protein